jgi:hypothetical protein
MKALVLVGALALGCAHTESGCPASYHPDAPRAARLRRLLERDPEARPLLSAQPAATCFAPGGANVTTDSALLLDASQPNDRLAARVAHLLAHRAAGRTRTSGNGPDEAPATALERRVLERLLRR